MKIVIRRDPDAVLSMAFGLLLLTVFANILFASTPLPWGGPNVILATASVLVLSIYVLMKRVRIDNWNCLAILLAACTLMVWAALVHFFTETHGSVLIGQIAMGIGLLCVTCMTTTTPGRARLIVQATVLATSLSALFGFGVIYAWDTFWPLWHSIADVLPRQMRDIASGRLNGITNGPETMASHIAVAVPFVLAMWMHGRRQDRMQNTVWNFALFLLLVFLVWAALATGYRSLTPALLIGGVVAVFTSMVISPELRPRLFRKLFVIALSVAVGTTLLFASGNNSYQRRSAVVPVFAADPLPESASCIESLGVLSAPISVSGMWSKDCKSSLKLRQYARYYTFTLERKTPLALTLNSSIAETYLRLLSRSRPDDEERHRQKERSGKADHTEVEIPAGKYAIEVSTNDSGTGERFRLQIKLDLAPEGTISLRSRYADLTDVSVYHRLHMFSAAYWYVLDHPLGAGGFFPTERHLDQDWSPMIRHDFMREDLHNHFLLVLTYYGLPGLILLVFFCGGILWSVIRSVRLARHVPNLQGAWLPGAVVGALTVYWLFRLFNAMGPFHTDWHHFILVGLALGMPRILSLPVRTVA